MNRSLFETIIDEQLNRCRDLLVTKSEHYAIELDSLHNFRLAAELRGTTMRDALSGMMAKHTVKLYDILAQPVLPKPDVFYEVLTDHINYLLLLAAIAEEEGTVHPKAAMKTEPVSVADEGRIAKVYAENEMNHRQSLGH